jgi:hypothetical protein
MIRKETFIYLFHIGRENKSKIETNIVELDSSKVASLLKRLLIFYFTKRKKFLKKTG